MTLLVRDEADIISPMLEYHLASGVDHILITDNGSIDGTREILSSYEEDPRISVVDDPIQDKNQTEKVTRMARRAATDFNADWVINADADEFFVPVDRRLTLGEVFRSMPLEIVSATVPVVDMTGLPGLSGVGLDRLVYRDQRPQDTLYERSGLYAHSTHDAIHVGDPAVVVAQGNHYVSLASQGEIPDDLRIESLHFPWRSFEQFRIKVENAGRAYEANRGVDPSPQHHGMRDYRFFRAGVLEESYIYRHPAEAEFGNADLPMDNWLRLRLEEILSAGSAVHSDLLRTAMNRPGVPFSVNALERARDLMPAVIRIDADRTAQATLLRQSADRVGELQREVQAQKALLTANEGELAVARSDRERAQRELERIRGRGYYRAASAAARAFRAAKARFAIGPRSS
ncbi:glycosyltransferase family 2 protein [Microbacterium lacticum]|uniref:glycosyltransferase family 2 protein n=1 Tax=Microbacterium lacticum TaxID=33885 RepID=UPI00242FEB19|nr:glycosyltransferase family 2 protein [Microbacterium lacticum]